MPEAHKIYLWVCRSLVLPAHVHLHTPSTLSENEGTSVDLDNLHSSTTVATFPQPSAILIAPHHLFTIEQRLWTTRHYPSSPLLRLYRGYQSGPGFICREVLRVAERCARFWSTVSRTPRSPGNGKPSIAGVVMDGGGQCGRVALFPSLP